LGLESLYRLMNMKRLDHREIYGWDELIESLADYPAAANFANTHELIFSVLAACGHAAAEDAFKAIFVNHRSYGILAFLVQ